MIHAIAWTGGEPASTIEHEAGELAERLPGKRWDYLDNAGMFLLHGDDCLLMPAGMHPKTMERFLHSLLNESESAAAWSFRLVPVADHDLVRRVAEEGGIRKVGLHLSRYHETGLSSATSLVEARSGLYRTLIGRQPDRRAIEDAANVKVELSVTRNGRLTGMPAEEFSPLALEMADNCPDDAVELETMQGSTIKRGELTLRKKVDVDVTGKTIHYNSAWEELQAYLTELIRSKMIQR